MLELKEIILNSKKYSYCEYGEGPDLVLLHGWCNSSRDYERLIIELGKYFRVFAPDLPNFGSSKANDLFSLETYIGFLDIFVKELNINNPLMVGHSFGGLLAMQYSYERKARGLVLINSLGLKTHKHLALFFLNILSNTIYETFTALKLYLRIFISWLNNYRRLILNRSFWDLIRYSVSNDYSKIELIDEQTLILWSKKDRIFSHDYPHVLEERINDSKLKLFPGGHFGCLVYAEEYVEEIVKEFKNIT